MLNLKTCITSGGYIDHGIFLVRDDCQSLDKGAEKVIVDRVPSDPMEWMAVVVIEEKVRFLVEFPPISPFLSDVFLFTGFWNGTTRSLGSDRVGEETGASDASVSNE